MDWSPQQDAALVAAAAWYRDRSAPQIFRLFGWAGTGKSTIARQIADDASATSGRVVFGAFTGKAALVMRSKGCWGARTIHSLIYTPEDTGGEPRFVLNPDSELAGAQLCVVDEVSMVGEELARDLLSFGTKVLVLGDPAQLPPVRGTGYFTEAAPDAMMTEIHRQARDNPIVRLSMDVREGRWIEVRVETGATGALSVVHRDGVTATRVALADQVLVGRNATRAAHNRRMRELAGRDPSGPEAGDKLICLRNDRQRGLFNGMTCSVVKVIKRREKTVSLVVRAEEEDSYPLAVTVRNEFFNGSYGELTWDDRRGTEEFTYGYAITVHKSQGSQWKSVVLFDESACFGDQARRWLYTGVTRAAEKLTVVLP